MTKKTEEQRLLPSEVFQSLVDALAVRLDHNHVVAESFLHLKHVNVNWTMSASTGTGMVNRKPYQNQNRHTENNSKNGPGESWKRTSFSKSRSVEIVFSSCCCTPSSCVRAWLNCKAETHNTSYRLNTKTRNHGYARGCETSKKIVRLGLQQRRSMLHPGIR